MNSFLAKILKRRETHFEAEAAPLFYRYSPVADGSGNFGLFPCPPSEPDFVAALPYAAGSQSMRYYLSLIGLPSSADTEKPILPVQKTSQIYACGLTTYAPREKPVSLPDRPRHILWLIRDPIGTIFHALNEMVGESLCLVNSDSIFKQFGSNLQALIDHLFKSPTRYLCAYSTILRDVGSKGTVYTIDVEDIMHGKTLTTLQKIADLFGVKIPDTINDKLNISYNNFPNRTFRYFPEIPVRISGNRSIGLYACPSHLYDFHFNNFFPSSILGEIQVNDIDFTIFTKIDIKTAGITFSIENSLDAVRFNIENFLEYRSLLIEQREKHLISKDRIVEFFLTNTAYYDLFMKYMDAELELVKEIAPQKMESWTYYKQLCR